jgi:uncharacterized tellurite resistance protein B-like protein/predicted nucleic acid-binding Zn ribbon protein
VIRRGGAIANAQEKSNIVASLRENDPAFDEAAFLSRVRMAFGKIQQAWCNQNLTTVRPFISDGVYERFSLQFDEQRAEGLRNQLDDLNIGDIEIEHGYADQFFDVLSIGIEASAIDKMVNIKDGKVLSGSTVSSPFVEIWTFIRRRGAKTDPTKPGLIEGNCPNCGAAIEMNQNANCQYCGAILRSGQYDWVLAEITQESEWQPGQVKRVPGVEVLLAKDPGFNLEAMEDRASVVFWRLATAERVGDVKPLSKAALPAFLEAYARDLKSRRDAQGNRMWYGDRAVGSVDTLGVLLAAEEAGPSSDSFDRALLEVRWSGTRFTADNKGNYRRHEQSSVSHLLLVLARKTGAKSDTDKSVDSAHCPTCGAPETGGASGVCEFCGAVLNDGSKSWALMDATSMSSPLAVELLNQLPRSGYGEDRPVAAPAPAHVLAWMVKMTLADGQLEASEREMLHAYAARYKIPPERVGELIEAAGANTLDVRAPANEGEARAILGAMAKVALADGKITREETALLLAAGSHLGLSEIDVTQLIARTKSEMYAQAKASLRQAKKGP